MTISVFDLFKIGIGPSSSHTLGPLKAAHQFVETLGEEQGLSGVQRIQIELFGSLAATGVGHGTDRAVCWGLMGETAETIDPYQAGKRLEASLQQKTLPLLGGHPLAFDPRQDLKMTLTPHPQHPNAVTFTAFGDARRVLLERTYLSIGGGFILQAGEHAPPEAGGPPAPYPFTSAADLLEHCRQNSLSISELMLRNEEVNRPRADIFDGLAKIGEEMKAVIKRGLHGQGELPGGLGVKRRAPGLHRALKSKDEANLITASLEAMDWVNLYALATNEENAAGGRIVTAPTNGAAGIIPAVLFYYRRFSPQVNEEQVARFLLTAGAIGILCKENASISGAEVGCQGEVGSACAMAAAGLTELLGGSPEQVENAAEIGLEHNLGLTCDPVAGLVQVPCIERNAIAAMKAINAAQIALRGDGEHFVSLDKVIKTMKETGADMQAKYKETSTGGLAVNVPEC
ncbi:L-serine ammonia-lyase [Motiliproteus sp. SC1-56]|uniref:L-serine ammonia-lyase n=1 Tax=Motiliproteus sp. SC1-56 TaxID=2799565 RepID=UPI001A8C84A9|nr:L-serine ammonia-lyase [Motiliproteus sp. SC1-56]